MIRKQIAAIEIADNDALDLGHRKGMGPFYLMKQRDIKNMIIMGVHTEMCVLDRAFGIQPMVRAGMNVLLIRDLTDSFALVKHHSKRPEIKPYSSHFRGTDLVIEWIEKYWCPTITSDRIVGGKPFRFKNDKL